MRKLTRQQFIDMVSEQADHLYEDVETMDAALACITLAHVIDNTYGRERMDPADVKQARPLLKDLQIQIT